MASIIEEIPQIVKTALILMPELSNIPVLGRIFVLLSAQGQLTDNQALEELQKFADNQKKLREKERDENARYVIKVSEALKCVDNTIYDPRIIMTYIRGIINTLAGGKAGSAPDLFYEKIKTCILENRLRQDTPRVFSKTFRYHRPSRGHGKGRTKFG